MNIIKIKCKTVITLLLPCCAFFDVENESMCLETQYVLFERAVLKFYMNNLVKHKSLQSKHVK